MEAGHHLAVATVQQSVLELTQLGSVYQVTKASAPQTSAVLLLASHHCFWKLIGSLEPLIIMMSIVYIMAKLHNDTADIVVLIVYTSLIMNDFMKAFNMLGCFSPLHFVTMNVKCGTIIHENKSCRTYLSSSRGPAGLFDLPHHCSHQQQREKTAKEIKKTNSILDECNGYFGHIVHYTTISN